MNPEKVRSKDHIDLTFTFARLQEDGYITKDDVERLKEIAERIEEPKLKWIVEEVRYIGEGRFMPLDKTSFITELDSIRYDIHRVIESRVEEHGRVHISEPELVAAIPDSISRAYRITATEEEQDTTVRRDIYMKSMYGENEIELNVIDDLDDQERTVKINAYGHVRSELEGIAEDVRLGIEERVIREGCEQDQFDDPYCYIFLHGDCEFAMHKILEEEAVGVTSKTVAICEIDLNPLREHYQKEYEQYKHMVDEIKEILKGKQCTVFHRHAEHEIRAVCDYSPVTAIYWDLGEKYQYDIDREADEILEERYQNEVLPEYEREWNEIGSKLPIPLDCEVSYGYPHYYGFYYYVRCKGEKDYNISLDEIAQSYKDIHNTLDEFEENVSRNWH